MSNDSYDFFTGGAPYFGFALPGTSITGVVSEEPHTRQQTDPKTGEPKVWKSGDPMMVLVITLQTTLRDPEINEDDGQRTIWVSSQGMREAIGRAVKATGRKGVDVGGTLTVVYTGDGEKTNPKLNAPKLFQAHYVPPSASAAFLNGGGNGAEQQQYSAPPPQAQFVAPQPVPQQTQFAPPPQPVYTPPPAAAPVNLPPGMTPELWQQLTPEARSALTSITGG